MKLILMTTPYFFVEEHQILNALFDEGLEILHLRKPSTEPVYSERLHGVHINRPAGRSVTHILSLTLPHIKSEVMLHYLSHRGIYISSGSACSSKSGRVSQTLLSFGLSEKEADATIRLSFSAQNTIEEADRFLEALSTGIQTLVPVF